MSREEEILEENTNEDKSAKENISAKEREVYIQKKSYATAFYLITLVCAIFIVVLYVQKLRTGETFIDPNPFFMVVLLGFVGRYMSLFKHKKQLMYLAVAMISAIGAFMYIAAIILMGIRAI